MKYVIVPPDITIMNRSTGKAVQAIDGNVEKDFVFTMSFFVERYIIVSSRVLRARPDEPTGDGLRRALKLQRAFENCAPGQVIGVEDADYKAVRAAVDNIDWPPAFAPFAPQVLPMIEAWEAAEKQDDEWKRKRDAEARRAAIHDADDDIVVTPPKAG
jgi:hypothetical protein